MREFSVDLVIDRTFNVFAETVEEAKEKAIRKAKEMLGSYNSLSIDFVYFNDGDEDLEFKNENEDVEFENEYEVLCFDPTGKCVYEYLIEADNSFGAAQAAEEFFNDDCPNETLATIRVLVGDQYDEYDIKEEA